MAPARGLEATGSAGPPSRPVEPPRFRPGWGVASTLFFGLLFLGGVLLAVTQLSEPRRFVVLLERANLWWLLPVVALQALTYVAAGAAWRVALLRGGAPVQRLVLARTSLAKLAFDQLIPSAGASGTAFLVYALRARGVPGALAFAVIFVEWAGYTLGYVVAVALTVAVLGLRDHIHPAILTLVVVFALLMLGRILGLLIARRLPHRRWPRWLTRFPTVELLLREAATAPRDVSTSPLVVAKSGVWHVYVYFLDAGTLFVCLLALGSPAHIADVYVAFMVASLAATVGVLPGGLGAFEATCVAVLVGSGTPLEDALAATVLLRGFTYWLPMLPGVILARRLLRSPARPADRHDARDGASARGRPSAAPSS